VSAEPEVSAVEPDEGTPASRHLDVALCYENARRAVALARVYERDGGAADPRRLACLTRVGELRAMVGELRTRRAEDAQRAGPGLSRSSGRAGGPGLARVAPSASEEKRRSGAG
jgi:hypothetical protein